MQRSPVSQPAPAFFCIIYFDWQPREIQQHTAVHDFRSCWRLSFFTSLSLPMTPFAESIRIPQRGAVIVSAQNQAKIASGRDPGGFAAERCCSGRRIQQQGSGLTPAALLFRFKKAAPEAFASPWAGTACQTPPLPSRPRSSPAACGRRPPRRQDTPLSAP